jgi:type VI secretion system protein ImpE
MTAKQLLDTAKVSVASNVLAARLRDHPTDNACRSSLFEMLCFAGQFDRAEKHLSILAGGGKEAEMGSVLYYSALHAERTRHELFRKQDFPSSPVGPAPPGTINGRQFNSIRDIDPVLGERLEVFAAGAYLWIPFEHIASVEMSEPRLLRDTLWVPAAILTGPSFKGTDIGQVLIPAIYPFSWKSDDEAIWLGRKTEWVEDDEGHQFPVGQKMFAVDGEEVSLLEIRSLEFNVSS